MTSARPSLTSVAGRVDVVTGFALWVARLAPPEQDATLGVEGSGD